MPFEKIAATVFEFYFGNQRRGMQYLPDEIEIFDEVRKIRLAEDERERAAEKKSKRRRKTTEYRKNDFCNGKRYERQVEICGIAVFQP